MNETKEFEFRGTVISGFVMLGMFFVLLGLSPFFFIRAMHLPGVVCAVVAIFTLPGFVLIEPNNLRVLLFFGKYRGTLRRNGFFWLNPFYTKTKLTMRARNLDIPPIKVNDKNGNPIMIGLVIVWRLRDTYKCMFEIDSSSFMAPGAPALSAQNRMTAYEQFVSIQSDAALRSVAGRYAYDLLDNQKHETTLRDGGEEVNSELEKEINERLDIAGIEAIEARINYLAYAPEIAAVMLRRQQAEAIIAAREKIVEGAVSMVDMALHQLKEKGVVELDNDKKAAMVSNLLVVLCSDEPAAPMINTTGESK